MFEYGLNAIKGETAFPKPHQPWTMFHGTIKYSASNEHFILRYFLFINIAEMQKRSLSKTSFMVKAVVLMTNFFLNQNEY